MGTGYIYTCGCEAPQPVMIGAGRLTPNLCADTWSDMLAGKYGDSWKRAVTMNPQGGLDCRQEIYLCDCGHWESDIRKTLWKNGDTSHCKSRLSRNKAVKTFYHMCPKCGKRMRIAHIDEDCLICPICGEEMQNISPEIKWD